MSLGPVLSSLDNAVEMVGRITQKVTHPQPNVMGGGVKAAAPLRPGEAFKPIKALPNVGSNINVLA